MRNPSRKPATVKVFTLFFLVLITLFMCSCENEGVSTEPKLGDRTFDGIYIGPTNGAVSIAGTPKFNKVVLCHQYNACIWYQVGTVDEDNGTVIWGANTEWTASMHVGDCAISPQVSVSDDGVVVCAFQTGNYSAVPAGKIYVGFGTISGNTINWGGFSYAGISGYFPSVAITRDGKYAVLVFQESSSGGAIYYSVTPINTNSNTMNWSAYSSFTAGHRPSIAMNDKDQLICIFNSWQDNGGLWYTAGQLYRNSSTIQTHGTYSFGSTTKSTWARPTVTMGDQVFGNDTSLYALASSSSDGVFERFYAGDIDQNGNVEWPASIMIDQWVSTASLTIGFNDNVIETYQDGNVSDKMYYFFYE